MKAFREFSGFLKSDTRVPSIKKLDVGKDLKFLPVTNVILPERTKVRVLDVHEKGEFVRVQFYPDHKTFPNKYTILPKERLMLDVVNRSKNTLFQKEEIDNDTDE